MIENTKEKAAINLNRLYNIIINKDKVDQTDLNVTSDCLRKYLGEHSHIYYSFSRIDINKDSRLKEIEEASKLIKTAIEFIASNGVYKDLQLEMFELQAKELRNKTKYAFWGAIGASILTLIITYAKEIGRFIIQVLHISLH